MEYAIDGNDHFLPFDLRFLSFNNAIIRTYPKGDHVLHCISGVYKLQIRPGLY